MDTQMQEVQMIDNVVNLVFGALGIGIVLGLLLLIGGIAVIWPIGTVIVGLSFVGGIIHMIRLWR